MSRVLHAPIVGAFNKPPAPTVLKHLPSGAPLILVPEPENPYDGGAIKVLVAPEAIPESQYSALEAELPLQGATLEQVMSSGPIWLGYVAKSGGKPLEKAQAASGLPLVGNVEIAGALVEAGGLFAASIVFGLDGKPLVCVKPGEGGGK